jgi:hypothetical protein
MNEQSAEWLLWPHLHDGAVQYNTQLSTLLLHKHKNGRITQQTAATNDALLLCLLLLLLPLLLLLLEQVLTCSCSHMAA